MRFTKNNLVLAVAVAGAIAAPSAFATNGMNMEGYGPVATAMGGASMAYDNGSAAVMNNPATLGLMKEGNELDLALGRLGPSVSGRGDDSSATAFYMPAIGFIKKQGQFSFGAGLFAQGGMGAEYDGGSYFAYGSGETVRSELGVGRIIFPFVYSDAKFSVGVTLDYVWAGLDLKMALPGDQFGDMVGALGGSEQYGSASGSMVDALALAMGGGAVTGVNWARFDFSDNNKFTQEAKATGYAGKLGFTYKIDPQWTIGATYHSKTKLDDMETSDASLGMNVSGPICGGPASCSIPVRGEITIQDFQWPETFGFGAAFQATDKLMVAADYKRIGWKAVMKDFKMSFAANSTQSGAASGFAGLHMDATLVQEWKDQNVFEVGASYKTTDALTLRGGINVANDPIPDTYVLALFPAIVKNHLTFGGGYALSNSSDLDVAITYAPAVKVTNGHGDDIKHSQMNLQLMYASRF